jgi:hypothetical protein
MGLQYQNYMTDSQENMGVWGLDFQNNRDNGI